MGSKVQEKACLDMLLNDSPKSQFGKEIQRLINGQATESERPDFIINNVGIEHFLVDVLYTTKRKRAMSLERVNSSTIVEKVDDYKENSKSLDDDIENGNAVSFIEDIVNSQINCTSDFSFSSFIENYRRIFNDHYDSRQEYRKKCAKLGFLIEIPYCSTHYLIGAGKIIRNQIIKSIPIPIVMLEHIWENNELDFVILYIHPINRTQKVKKKDVSLIYIDPQKRSYYGEKIVLCDWFDFQYKFRSRDVIKLNKVN